MRADELVHDLRSLLARLAKHPADRLADKELLLVEHPRGKTREQHPIPLPALQLIVLREERGAADPEVLLRSPFRQPAPRRRIAPDDVADDPDGEPIDVRPRVRRVDEIEEPGQVALLEHRSPAIEQPERRGTQVVLVGRVGAERDLAELAAVEIRVLARVLPRDAVQLGQGHAVEGHVALQVRLVPARTLGGARRPEAPVERREPAG